MKCATGASITLQATGALHEASICQCIILQVHTFLGMHSLCSAAACTDTSLCSTSSQIAL